ncbi:hypothetical protein ACXR6G_01235 [Ancylomarina sp. YFZ004]
MTSHNKLKIHTGKYFPKPLNLIGYIGIIFGIIELFESPLLGFTLIIIGSYLSFNQAGFEIENGRFRNFFYLLHFKIGKWETSDLPHISILKRRFVRKTYGGRTPVSVTEKEFVYEITLLSETQKTRFKLLRINDFDKAKVLEDRIANLLGVKKID